MKKAQIKMLETIAILVIFFFLLIFGFGFYARIQQVYYEEQKEKNAALKALQIAQKSAYMPEFQCSVQNIQDDNCFDIYKVRIFNKKLYGDDGIPQSPPSDDDSSLKSTYYDILGHSELLLQQIYPEVDPDDENITIYSNLLADSSHISSNMIPVSIFDGGTREYSIGILHIKVSSID
jgi:hypothetical protein